MKSMGYGLLLACQFLTRIPIPINCPWDEKTIKWALRFFPIIGVILGIILNGIFLISSHLPEWMTAFLLLTVWIGYTGGLHLDGWMDVSDAVASNGPIEKKWEIMKDSHIGSFAVLSLLFLLGWKLGFLYEIGHRQKWALTISFVLVPSLSRWGALLFMFFLPTIKNSGLAWEWKKYLTSIDLLISAVPVIIICFVFPFFLSILLAYFLFLLLYMRWAMYTFKGINGDLVGTAIEGGELWILFCIWIFMLFGMV